MSNLGRAVELKGIAIGREQGKIEGIDIGRKQEKEQLSLEHIRNVMESTKWSAQQVMDAMKIPKSEQAHYAAMLDTDNKETLDALKEVEDMKKHPEKYKGFSSVDELISDLNDKNTKE